MSSKLPHGIGNAVIGRPECLKSEEIMGCGVEAQEHQLTKAGCNRVFRETASGETVRKILAFGLFHIPLQRMP
jgi:hypothetical protein